MRRLALAVAITAAAVNPSGAIDPFRDARPAIPRQVVRQEPSTKDVRNALAYVATVVSSPFWHRMIDTLTYPPDHTRACPYERLIQHTFSDWPGAVSVAWRESRCQPNGLVGLGPVPPYRKGRMMLEVVCSGAALLFLLFGFPVLVGRCIRLGAEPPLQRFYNK